MADARPKPIKCRASHALRVEVMKALAEIVQRSVAFGTFVQVTGSLHFNSDNEEMTCLYFNKVVQKAKTPKHAPAVPVAQHTQGQVQSGMKPGQAQPIAIVGQTRQAPSPGSSTAPGMQARPAKQMKMDQPMQVVRPNSGRMYQDFTEGAMTVGDLGFIDFSSTGVVAGMPNVHPNQHLRPKICRVCGYEAANKAIMRHHNRTEHADLFNTIICPKCSLGFRKMRVFNEHFANTHLAPIQCPLCEMRFTNKFSFQRHHKKKHDNQIYTCSMCNENFQTTQYMEFDGHMNKHKGSQPYECPACKVTYEMRSLLITHYASCEKKETSVQTDARSDSESMGLDTNHGDVQVKIEPDNAQDGQEVAPPANVGSSI